MNVLPVDSQGKGSIQYSGKGLCQTPVGLELTGRLSGYFRRMIQC